MSRSRKTNSTGANDQRNPERASLDDEACAARIIADFDRRIAAGEEDPMWAKGIRDFFELPPAQRQLIINLIYAIAAIHKDIAARTPPAGG